MSSDEMKKKILQVAEQDDRIRAVTMEGSRANKDATHDEYSDFDICYYVTDVREFSRDDEFMKQFGQILIVQKSMDWYSHPYDYEGHEDFVFLTQYQDGNRIDLTFVDLRNIKKQKKNREPRVVLLNKDHFPELLPVDDQKVFYVQKPTEMEYFNTCNEFRWLSVYISKGLCREELPYARHAYEVHCMEMFLKMLDWKAAIPYDFQITTGAHSKYLKRFLSVQEQKRFQGIFPNGTYRDIWDKLFLMYDYFAENAQYVAEQLHFSFDETETKAVRSFLLKRRMRMV